MNSDKFFKYLFIVIAVIVIIFLLVYLNKEYVITDIIGNLGVLEEWRIPATEIKWNEHLGAGSFGIVHKGTYNGTMIAAKTFNNRTMSRQEFLQEATTMTNICHKNIVKMHGVCDTSKGCFIILEYMSNGDLLQFLQKNKTKLTLENLVFIAKQLALGMKYLEDNNIIHRDVAARNCLVGENLVTKIADFGLTRKTPYVPNSMSVCALRWCAQENYNLYQPLFSTKSDVFSYGIMLMEIFTYGAIPYSDKNNYQVVCLIKNGIPMEKPHCVTPYIYELYMDCCKYHPEERPSFHSVYQQLEEYKF